MNSSELDALTIQKMASGHLCLNLSERVTWEGFPDFAEKLLQATGGEVVRKTDGPEMRLWKVRIYGSNLVLVFDDYPVMTSLESTDRAGDIVIERLERELLQGAN
ncbi:MAG TPA: DUF3630 family protein [Chthoniobacteraceae bacterium]|jgi:hypothetical protein|nr:DUF3630 family protein [Chthoniobacteraceae bacterium]